MRTCKDWKDFEEKVRAAEYDVAFVGFLSLDVFTATCAVRVLKEAHPRRPVVVGGLHVSCCEMMEFPAKPGQPYYLPDLYLNRDDEMHPMLRTFLKSRGEYTYDPAKFPQADVVIWNEAEIAACKVVEELAAGRTVPPFINAHNIPDLNETPHADRDLFNTEFEANAPLLDYLPTPFFTITFGRGCPYKCAFCITGDSPVNTIYGEIPIKDLVGREVPVYTYDLEKKKLKISIARNIRKTRADAETVRVHFDDGTYIDCTPDHKFLQIYGGNAHMKRTEIPTEAASLRPGKRVVAFRERPFAGDCKGRVLLYCYKDMDYRSRIIASWKLGRKLATHEEVHHLDENWLNDHPDNLEVRTSVKDHCSRHINIKKKRRVALQNLKLARKAWNRLGRNYRIPNHVVVKVERLNRKEDVYCLEVPETGWFFVNHVLVKNCNVGTQLSSAKVRLIDPDYFMDELEHLKARFGKIGSLMIHDDILLDPRWLADWNVKLRDRFGYTPYWCQMRADFICRNEALMKTMAECGLAWVSIGLESGDQRQLDMMGKQTTVEQNIRSCKILRDLGVNVFGNWMLGLPDETHEQRMATAAMMAEVAKGGIRHSASVYCNYPGTSLEKYIAIKDMLLPTWYTRSHFPWQRALKDIDYADVYKVQGEVTSKYPNRATRPKHWKDK
jgi:radical SAM superfamily enzyme YgiQ (UPF0313 family)